MKKFVDFSKEFSVYIIGKTKDEKDIIFCYERLQLYTDDVLTDEAKKYSKI